MINKIVYIVKSDLAYYPPCLSQIQMIHDLGIDIEVWFGSSKQTAIDIMSEKGIPFIELVDPRGKYSGKMDVVSNWLSFRFAVAKRLHQLDRESTLLWFGTAESVMPLEGALSGFHYVVSALELYDDLPMKKALLGPLCRRADACTACETTRAYIMKSWWNLESLPYVFPNKPYGMALRRELPLSCDVTRKIIDELGGSDFVIYQGILQNEESVAEIARALKLLGGHYPLVLMGIDRNGMAPRIKKVYEGTRYYESIPAPKHLEITSRARFGVVFYDGANLNKAFCAPNKIYEYSSFGMPMLANDIPGLANTVGAWGCAECVKMESNSIADALTKMDADYDAYSKAATAFFEHTDNLFTMRHMLADLGVMRHGY